MKVSFRRDIFPCGWLDLKHQLTEYCFVYDIALCIALYCVLHCIVYLLHYVLHCIVYCIALYIALHCVLHCIVCCIKLCTVLHQPWYNPLLMTGLKAPTNIVLHCVLYCTVYCIALCIVLCCSETQVCTLSGKLHRSEFSAACRWLSKSSAEQYCEFQGKWSERFPLTLSVVSTRALFDQHQPMPRPRWS